MMKLYTTIPQILLFTLACIDVHAGVYVGGGFGVSIGSMSIQQKRNSAFFQFVRKKADFHQIRTELLPTIRKEIEKAFTPLQFGRSGSETLSEGVDFTPGVFSEETKKWTGGFGLAGKPETLRGAEKKLQRLFNRFSSTVAKALPSGSGFYVEGDPHVRIVGEPGSAREIQNERVFLKNSYYPSFSSDLIQINKYEDKFTPLLGEDFVNSPSLHRSIVDNFFQPASANLFQGWNAVTDEDPVGTTVESTELKASEETLQQSVTHIAFRGVVGIHKTFYWVPEARFGTYLGAELGWESSAGTATFQAARAKDQTSFSVANQTFVYDKPMPVLRHVLSVRENQSWALTAFAGVSLRGGWSIYVPFTLRWASYKLTATHDQKGLEAYKEAAKKGLMAKLNGELVAGVEPNLKDRPGLQSTDCLTTEKVSFESGLGVRCALTKHLTLGVRWTMGFPIKIDWETKPYASDAAHDLDKLGTKNNVSVRDSRFGVEILWNFWGA